MHPRLETNVLRRSLALGVCDSVDAMTPRKGRRTSATDRALTVVGWLALIAIIGASLVAAR